MSRTDDHASVSSLVELVHRFYPAGVASYEPEYDASEESRRREALRMVAIQEGAAWEELRQGIQETLPDVGLWELPSLLYHPCRTLRAYLPHSPRGADVQEAVVLLVSILAPVHAIYASHQTYAGNRVVRSRTWFPPLPPRFGPVEARLDALAHSMLGSVRLPNEVLFTPVPDLHMEHVPSGKAQLLHCLFTHNLW
ncbi:hypothetical protein [Archangium sp.]|uniref:hypothetical protein n=1 Tax=Archangium sp. TaxID=1872627 RepID=UPI002D2FE276|nr:hypothetical protein [Archangium sp.]HYO56571.1 hypothetical protein [Archangium sp.]